MSETTSDEKKLDSPWDTIPWADLRKIAEMTLSKKEYNRWITRRDVVARSEREP
jgi:hypothetical protein